MQRPTTIIVLSLGLAALVAVNLITTIWSGRARGVLTTLTRKAQPAWFCCYVFADCVVLALCAGAILWGVDTHHSSSARASRTTVQSQSDQRHRGQRPSRPSNATQRGARQMEGSST